MKHEGKPGVLNQQFYESHTLKMRVSTNSIPVDTKSDSPQLPLGKRDTILKIALHLFTTQGFHATPTSQISKEAGISTGTLFHYFPDKNALFEQLYLSIKREMAEAVRRDDDTNLDPRSRLERCFSGFVTWGVTNPEKFLFIEQFYHSPSISDAVKKEAHAEFSWMNEIGAAAIQRGILRDMPPEFYFVIISQILFGVIKLISSGNTGMSSENLIRSGLDLIWQQPR